MFGDLPWISLSFHLKNEGPMAPPWHMGRVTSLQDVEELWDSDVATEIPATWPRAEWWKISMEIWAGGLW